MQYLVHRFRLLVAASCCLILTPVFARERDTENLFGEFRQLAEDYQILTAESPQGFFSRHLEFENCVLTIRSGGVGPKAVSIARETIILSRVSDIKVTLGVRNVQVIAQKNYPIRSVGVLLRGDFSGPYRVDILDYQEALNLSENKTTRGDTYLQVARSSTETLAGAIAFLRLVDACKR